MYPRVIGQRRPYAKYLVQLSATTARVLDIDNATCGTAQALGLLTAYGGWLPPAPGTPDVATLDAQAQAVTLARFAHALETEWKGNPDQPRDEHGRFASGGGGGGGGGSDAAPSAGALRARMSRVNAKLTAAGGMNGPNSTQALYDKVDGQEGRYTAERTALHMQIVNAHFQKYADVPSDHEAIISGGLPGSGKTSSLARPEVSDALGADAANDYMPINSDDIKETLAGGGHYQQVDALSPMEHASLLHNESGDVADLIAARAMATGKNVLFDITGNSQRSLDSRITVLKANGYRVKGAFVDVTPKVAAQRATARYARGMRSYAAGKGNGGRYVPSSVITSQAAPAGSPYSSKNRAYFEATKNQFDGGYAIVDNSGSAPRLLEKGAPTA